MKNQPNENLILNLYSPTYQGAFLSADMGPTDSVPFVNVTSNRLIHKEVEKAKFGLNLQNDYESDLLLKRLDESIDVSSGDDGSPTKCLGPTDVIRESLSPPRLDVSLTCKLNLGQSISCKIVSVDELL
jgi:hypothetical protein